MATSESSLLKKLNDKDLTNWKPLEQSTGDSILFKKKHVSPKTTIRDKDVM